MQKNNFVSSWHKVKGADQHETTSCHDGTKWLHAGVQIGKINEFWNCL